MACKYDRRKIMGLLAQTCPVCNGRGWMPEEFYSGISNTTTTSRVTCKSCGGGGVVFVGD